MTLSKVEISTLDKHSVKMAITISLSRLSRDSAII
jgi:hypothetical protein